MVDVHLSPLGNLQVPRTTKDAGTAPPQPDVLSQHTLFPSRPMMLITFTARCCQCVENKLLSPLWGLLFSCHGVFTALTPLQTAPLCLHWPPPAG